MFKKKICAVILAFSLLMGAGFTNAKTAYALSQAEKDAILLEINQEENRLKNYEEEKLRLENEKAAKEEEKSLLEKDMNDDEKAKQTADTEKVNKDKEKTDTEKQISSLESKIRDLEASVGAGLSEQEVKAKTEELNKLEEEKYIVDVSRGFYKYLGADDALALFESDAMDKPSPKGDGTLGDYTDFDSENDATHIDNVEIAAQELVRINELRGSEGIEPIPTNHYMNAIGQVHSNAYREIQQHPNIYGVGENAWNRVQLGTDDEPEDIEESAWEGWFTWEFQQFQMVMQQFYPDANLNTHQERLEFYNDNRVEFHRNLREIEDEDNPILPIRKGYGQVGHYINILRDYAVQGYGFSTKIESYEPYPAYNLTTQAEVTCLIILSETKIMCHIN